MGITVDIAPIACEVDRDSPTTTPTSTPSPSASPGDGALPDADDGEDPGSGTNDDEGLSTTGIYFPFITAVGAVALATLGVVLVYANHRKSCARS